MPLGGSIALRITSTTSFLAQPRASAARSWLAMLEANTGHADPMTFSKSGAGPPWRSRVAATAASSCTGLTGLRTRASWPAASNTAINERKS